MKSNALFTYQDAQQHEQHGIYHKSVFNASKTFPHMDNIMSLKTCITYGEYAA